jgi:hypothetical protein
VSGGKGVGGRGGRGHLVSNMDGWKGAWFRVGSLGWGVS